MKTQQVLCMMLAIAACLIVSSCSSTGEKSACHPSSGICAYQIYEPAVEGGSVQAACTQMFLKYSGTAPPPQSMIQTQADADHNGHLGLFEVNDYLRNQLYQSTRIDTMFLDYAEIIAFDFGNYTDNGYLPVVSLLRGGMIAVAGYSKDSWGSKKGALILDPASPGSDRGKYQQVSFGDFRNGLAWTYNPYGSKVYYTLVQSFPPQVFTANMRQEQQLSSPDSRVDTGQTIRPASGSGLLSDDPWVPFTFEDTVRMYARNALSRDVGGGQIGDAAAQFGQQFGEGYLGDVIPTSQITWQPGGSTKLQSDGPSIYMYVVEIRTYDVAHPAEVIGGIGLKKGYLADSVVFIAAYPILSGTAKGDDRNEMLTSAVSRRDIEVRYGNPVTAFVSEQDGHSAMPLFDMPNWLTTDSAGQDVIIDFWGRYLTLATASDGSHSLIPSGETFVAKRGQHDPAVLLPVSDRLCQNTPNPFNPQTEIGFVLDNCEHVTIVVTNVLGQKVAKIVDDRFDPGPHSVLWNGKDDSGNSLPSGVYLYTMTAGTYSHTRKMVLLK